MAEELKDQQQGQGNDDKIDNPNPTDEKVDKNDDTKNDNTKTLTQDEVNEIVKKRVNDTKSKYSDYDDIKAKLEEYENAENERKRSEQSELENVQQDLSSKDQELETTRQELERLQGQIKTDKINRAFEKQARAAGIEYIDDARSLADLTNVEVTDDGVKGIDEIVKGLVDNKPFLLKQSDKQRQIGDRNNGEQTKGNESAEELLKKAAEKARKSGRLEDKIAYVNLKDELTK